jgi:hypothetical protein
MIDLTRRTFTGVILAGLDLTRKARYKVYIPELMHNLDRKSSYVWCRNLTHGGSGDDYGSYSPVHAGTNVQIKFDENDLHSGYISAILGSDDRLPPIGPQLPPPSAGAAGNSSADPPPSEVLDRDQITIVARTKGGHSIMLYDGSSVGGTSIIISSSGGCKIVLTGGEVHILSPGSMVLKSGGDMNLTAGGNVNIKGANINLN